MLTLRLIFCCFFEFFTIGADNKILSALTAYEPEILMAGVESNVTGDPALKIINVMSDLYDRELVSTIGWAKQIPGKIKLAREPPAFGVVAGAWLASLSSSSFRQDSRICHWTIRWDYCSRRGPKYWRWRWLSVLWTVATVSCDSPPISSSMKGKRRNAAPTTSIIWWVLCRTWNFPGLFNRYLNSTHDSLISDDNAKGLLCKKKSVERSEPLEPGKNL